MLPIGQPAPALSLPDQHGNIISLADLRGRHNVVLFFYPKDDTPGCIREACAFRDALAEITARDAVVIGVSRDGAASHQAFAQRWQLPFTLLSDLDGSANKVFEVKRTLGLFGGRVTYVIDKQGIVRGAYRDALDMRAHVQAALHALAVQGSV